MLLTRLAGGDCTQHIDSVRVRKDGMKIDVSLTLSPLKDPPGRIVGASKIVRDMTDAKRAQRDLEKAYTEVKQLKEKLQAESEYLQQELRNTGA